ncbi:dynamin associated protein 160 isoform X3 [Rhodnius prolixus]|uniref:dynamin associated protein 160 isoform X3 n=1 Tax=Rhodnius prolixus TaxID=13249 RepID=UPI003D18DD3C
MDPYVITPAERARFEQQFLALKPINGIVTGDQAKGFLLQSQLPPAILGVIWALADTDADGKMNINEFSIACKLINLKLRGFDIPKSLPPALQALVSQPAVLTTVTKPPIPPLPSNAPLIPGLSSGLSSNVTHERPPGHISPPSGGPSPVVSPPLVQPLTPAPPIPPLPQVMRPAKPPLPQLPPQPVLQQTLMSQPTVLPQQPLLQQTVLTQQPLILSQPVIPHQAAVPPPSIPPQPLIAQQPVMTQPTLISQTSITSAIPPQPIQPIINSGVMPPLTPMPPLTAALTNVAAVPPNTLSNLITNQPNPPSAVPVAQPAPPSPPLITPAVHPLVDRAASVESPLTLSSPPLVEWAVPQASKLKYTQLFNTTDKTRSGFLTGVQARNILLASKLPQPVLAQIWGLSDMDADGRLSCEEFVLALHLCDLARAGETLPPTLPPNLVPPTLRRARNNSLSATSDQGDPMAGLSQVTFEDKRKENFEKGQAELDRRRKALLEIQKKEQEERERKEREEREKQEKIRLEQERKRQEEFERQVERQKEIEKAKEEERKRVQEQREAARREMERQRQLEWEKQRNQELQNQRQKQQEFVLSLKAKSQALSIELSQKEEKVKELSCQISETRCGVTSVKSVIDGMRATRDQNLAEYNKLKALLKQRNQQVVALSQQKAKLEAQGKLQGKDSAEEKADVLAFNNKTIVVKNLKDKLADLDEQVKNKVTDVENNNSQLENLKSELSSMITECEKLYAIYEAKRNKIMEMRGNTRLDNSWGDAAWETAPTQAWPEEVIEDRPGFAKYRGLYEFVARNADELSFQPGDIILVPTNQASEPGWLSGELREVTGWFPESYVEPLDSAVTGTDVISNNIGAKTPLEGIAEVAENVSESGSLIEDGPSLPVGLDPILGLGKAVNMTAVALYPFTARKSGQLSFVKGESLSVTELQDQWCYGQLNLAEGWFPKSYVKLEDVSNVSTLASQNQSITGTTTEILPPEGQEYYIAMYPYASDEVGDLTFDQGETILVVAKDGDWWTGVIGNRSGIFPSNYVQKCETVAVAETAAELAMTTSTGTSSILETNTVTSVTPTPKSPVAASPVPVEEPLVTEKRTTPVSVEAQITEDGRAATPDFTSLSSQVESGSGEESDSKSKSRKPLIATVIAPYQATSSEQLSLQRGQLIMIRKKTATGWWEGELQAKGKKRQIGWFPASYVKLLGGSGRGSQPTSRKTSESGLNDNLLERVVALYQYVAQNEDELSFEKDDLVTILAKDEPSWWKGECKGAVGLFPSNYVGPICNTWDDDSYNVNGVKVKISKEEKKRQQYIKELILTEQAYIDDMSIVHDIFEKPLAESKIISSEQLRTIFINWHDIIECNYTFLRSLRVRREMSKGGIIKMIGDILCENLPRMMVYVRFCSCQLRAATLLQNLTENNKDFLALTKQCQADPRTQGLPLSSFLIKPMQRITKYPLLISKILEYTPRDHSDRLYLEEALSKAEELCNQINESVREKENTERLEWLQSHVLTEKLTEPLIYNSLTNALGPRKFLHFGVLTKTKSGKELVGFLMNDFLLLAQPNRTLGGTFNFERDNNVLFRMYKQPLMLSETSIVTTPENGNTGGVELKLEHNRILYNLSACSPNDRVLWLRKLSLAQADLRRKETENFRRQQSINREVFCEVSMGSQEHRTPAVHSSISSDPVWNTSMQFLVKDFDDDVLCFTVKEKGNFSPDHFLGRTELPISDVITATKDTRGPITKELRLHEVRSGLVKLRLDLHFFGKVASAQHKNIS